MSDLIRRQDAVNALDKRFDDVPMELTTEILLLRKDLREVIPSATCGNLEKPEKPQHSEGEAADCNLDCIDRQEAIRWVKSECNPYGKPTLDYESGIKVIEHLERMPSAQSETHDKRTETHACDLIDRQEAIDEINKLEYPSSLVDVKRIIVELPSAQPDLDEWCTDCKEYDSERHCCPRFNRVIREALKEAQPEVIHCRDCRYENMGECEHKFGLLVANEENYCSYAERREE